MRLLVSWTTLNKSHIIRVCGLKQILIGLEFGFRGFDWGLWLICERLTKFSNIQIDHGGIIMSNRANSLAKRIEAGAEALASFVENLSDSEWETVVPNDKRTVGILVHHVASVYPIEIELAQALASGKPIAGVTWDAINQMNAQHAQEHSSVNRSETVKMLRKNSKIAADAVRKFSDNELDSAASISLNSDAPLTAQFFIEDHALSHSFHHLANIRAALGQ